MIAGRACLCLVHSSHKLEKELMKNVVLALTLTAALFGSALTASRAEVKPAHTTSTIEAIIHVLPCWDCELPR